MRHANPAPTRRAAHCSDGAFVAAGLVSVVLTALVALGARTWIDQPFAGFFDELHRRIAAKPEGSPFTYTLTDGATTERVTIASRGFSVADYWAVFGAYLSTGLWYVLLAIVAAWALPARPLGRALLFLGGVGGLFMLSSADLYPPASSLRVHALAAAFLPATLLQFALVVGGVRRRFVSRARPTLWAGSLVAAVSMQFLIGDHAATRWIQPAGDAALGLALLAATVGLIAARHRVDRETASLIAAAALFGLGVPAVIYLLAGTLGSVPVNASAILAFLFPLGMTVAILRGDPTLHALDVARPDRSL